MNKQTSQNEFTKIEAANYMGWKRWVKLLSYLRHEFLDLALKSSSTHSQGPWTPGLHKNYTETLLYGTQPRDAVPTPNSKYQATLPLGGTLNYTLCEHMR